jgi:hypothetical protein
MFLPLMSIAVLSTLNTITILPNPIDQQHAAIQLLGADNVDWQELIYQNATGMDHNIGLSGAVKQFPYRLSVGYTDKNGC